MKNIFILLSFIFFTFSLTYSQTGGKLSGLVYSDYYYNAMRDTGISSQPNVARGGPEDANGFDLRRAYLTYDYIISENFNTRFRLEADGRTLTDNKKIGVFVKDAWIKWKEILPGQEIIFGIQPTPAYEISESFYGYRSLEKTIMDLRGIVTARDFGLALRGNITGDLNYWFLFGNNSANNPEKDKYKRLYGQLSFKPVKNMIATVYGDLEFRPEIKDPASNNMIGNNVLTTALFLGYTEPKVFSVGAETFFQITENGYFNNTISPAAAEELNGLGISVFGWYNFTEKIGATLRYDFFDPGFNKEVKNDSRNYIIVGLSYRPIDKFAVIPNVLVETYEDLPQRQVDASVTPRITLSYEF